jgi:4a-hydroxytetrahydrobiopterin dehydratase
VYIPVPTENECLTPWQQEHELSLLPSDWILIPDSENGDSIFRSFEFSDFQHAFVFMTEGAQLAEKNQHHPDWRNLYNVVNVTLTTDDKACLGSFDLALAHGLDYAYLRITKATEV